jgi:spore germination protein GerM
MVEPTGHCPYLGLKQNRAIRFASPTPEHRCYVSGEPLDIPVDQGTYCLSQGHVHCPLYMGLSLPTTTDAAPTVVGGVVAAAPTGVRGWFATLSTRDRAIYAIMLGMLAVIMGVYLFAGLCTFFGGPNCVKPGQPATSTPIATPQPVVLVATAAPTDVPATPTDLPTNTPGPTQAEPSATQSTLILPTLSATSAPSATRPPSATSAPASPTRAPSATSAPSATRPPAPPPTSAPANPTPRPTQAPPVAGVPQSLTLYFADATGTLYVPVERMVPVVENQVARAAIEALINGPRQGLQPVVLPNVKLLDIQIAGATATVNFDRPPTEGGDRGLYAMTLTLTQFPNIHEVQFRVNGANIGAGGSHGPVVRPTLNPLNPAGLSYDTHETEFLPLYFPLNDGVHDVRIIRMVPKTLQTAEGTVRALLEGPGEYGDRVRTVIPNGTELRGIQKVGSTVTLDFTQPFANASNRAAAVRTIVESLTTLKTITGVQFLVEGHSLADQWGDSYGKVFGRRSINPE